MNPYAPALTMASLFMLSIGCSSAPAGDPIAGEPPVETTAAPLTYLNPCDPAWQLPTSAEGDPVDDAVFRSFEHKLAAGGALWIGSLDLPAPHRAIVQVDVYESTTKKLADSHLWFLAAIPIDSSAALAAVDRYAHKPPVNSKALGYCLNDKTFIPLGAPIPINQKPVAEITEYDPRCVCRVADGLIDIVEQRAAKAAFKQRAAKAAFKWRAAKAATKQRAAKAAMAR